jgi:hypothetical protein
MAKRPSWLPPKPNEPRRFGYVKLPGPAKRWRDPETGETISDRKMADLARRARGVNLSKEKYQKALERGEAKYASKTVEKRQQSAKWRRDVRAEIPDITDEDLKIIVKFRNHGGGDQSGGGNGFNSLTEDEQERFEELFEEYDKGSVREALGSPRRQRQDKQSNARRTERGKRRRNERRARMTKEARTRDHGRAPKQRGSVK